MPKGVNTARDMEDKLRVVHEATPKGTEGSEKKLIERTREDIEEDLEHPERRQEGEGEEEAPQSARRIKTDESQTETEETSKVTGKIKGLEGVHSAEKSNAAELAAAMEQDGLLSAVFISSDPVGELEKRGIKVPSKKELVRIMDGLLQEVGDRTEAMKSRYKPKQSLSAGGLDVHGITPDMLPEFSEILEERLREITASSDEKSGGSSESASPAPTPPPEPAPSAPEPPAPEPKAAPEPAPKPAKSGKKGGDGGGGKKGGDEGKEGSGDEKKKETAKKTDEEIDAETTARLLKKFGRTPEFNKLGRLLKRYKADAAFRERMSRILRGSEDQVQEFLEGFEEDEVTPETVARHLVQSVEVGKMSIGRARRAIGVINTELEKGMASAPTSASAPSAEPEKTESAPAEPVSTPEAPVDVASEIDARTKLKDFLERLTEGNKALEELHKRLEEIFDILETDLSEYSEADREFLEDIQEAMRDILLSELPQAFEGLGDYKSLTALQARLRLIDHLKKRAGIKKLGPKLVGNEELIEAIEDFRRVSKKTGATTEAPAEPATTESTSEPAPSTPEATTEQPAEEVHFPDSLAPLVDEVAEGNEDKKRRLGDLWKVYEGRARFEDDTVNELAKGCMRRALEFSRSHRLSFARIELEEALRFDGDIVPVDGSDTSGGSSSTEGTPFPTGPSGTPGGSPFETTNWGSWTASSTPSASPDTTDTGSSPDAQSSGTEPANARAEKTEYFISPERRIKAINGFLVRMGFPKNNVSPVVMAIRSVLEQKIGSRTILTKLEAYLEAGKELSEAEKLAYSMSETELKTQLHETAGEMAGIDQQIDHARIKLRKLSRAEAAPSHSIEAQRLATEHSAGELQTMQSEVAGEDALNEVQLKQTATEITKVNALPDDPGKTRQLSELEARFRALNAKKTELKARAKYIAEAFIILSEESATSTRESAADLNRQISELERQKSELDEKRSNLRKALAIKPDLEEEEPQNYANEPERLLTMINRFFMIQSGKKKPKFGELMTLNQKQIETAQSADAGKWYWVANRLFPHNYLKPTLTSSLVAICEKDDALKGKISAEKARELAKAWDDQESVKGWIQSLGSPDSSMKVVVPKLIAHLAHVTKVGKMANINSLSLNRARWLMNKLQREVHDYAVKKAERSGKKKTMDKMQVYFDQMNEVNENSSAEERIAREHSRAIMWRNSKILGASTLVGTGIGAGVGSILTLSGATLGIATAASGAGVLGASSLRIKDPKMRARIQRLSARTLVGGSLGALALTATSPWIAAPLGVAALTGCFTPEVVKNRAKIWKGTKKYGPGVAYVGYRGVKTTIGVAGLPLNIFKSWRRFWYS